MKTLPGQEVKHTDYAELLAEVDALLWEAVYKPVVALVKPLMPKVLRPDLGTRTMTESTAQELHNSAKGEAALKAALKDGRVQMRRSKDGEDAVFTVAKVDRLISDGLRSFGAKLNKATGEWICPRSQVPTWVKIESEGYNATMRGAHDAVKKLLEDIDQKIDELIDRANFAKAADHAITEVAGGWKTGAKKLEVNWNFGPAGEAALDRAMQRTREIPIKSQGKVAMVTAVDASTKKACKVWAKEALARLRAEVDINASQGYRAEGLAERIRNEYGVSKSRADLIARQETNNFMAAYREARAADAGLKRYQWYCVRDARTRKDHKALHGKVFYYAKPPITNTATGARNNPGQDFRCRCTDLPIIE